MSEKAMAILEKLSSSIENATELQKEYLLGYAECMAQSNISGGTAKRNRRIRKSNTDKH